MARVPWGKVKELAMNLAGQLWDEEEKEMRRIIEQAKSDEDKQIVVSYAVTIDCSLKTPTIKAKISFSEKFSETASGSVDDPDQLILGEKPPTVDEAAEELEKKKKGD